MKTARILCTVVGFLLLVATAIGCRTVRSDATAYNVRSFGAKGDGKTLDHRAINRAIAAAAQAGGGTVVVPPGVYLCGSIDLKSNIHLVIEAGATILGAPQNLNAYDLTEPWTNNPYQDGGHCYFHNSLIWGENLTNVFITGHGMINGGGLVRNDSILDRMCGNARWSPTLPYEPLLTNYPPVRLGNKAIALKLCRNVLIRDITICHGGHFAILVTGCDGLTVDNVTMDTDRDGIDIDCCRNTMVSNCRINSPNDDALCLKSSFALGRRVITENLTIVNCQVSGFQEGTLLDGTMKPDRTHMGRIKFGTEAAGGFRNCTIANCTFRNCKGLALEEVDGGIMENISINNLTMMDGDDYAIYLTTGKRNRSGQLDGPSLCRNISISDVIADGVGRVGGVEIFGMPDHPIEGLRLNNIRLISNGGGTRADAARTPRELGYDYPEPGREGIMPAYGVFARHVKGLELGNFNLSYKTNDLRPAIVCSDVNGLEIDNFNAQVADGVPASVFNRVTGLTIRNSPGLERE
ncbi:MAG TPA: glycosyl hydrolase family 28-related protein [Verrucomicrobiae bacterium]|nr:glycosyl hydrolase family 28-related protein [Verrucomicrobiae bacterium]